ncbi:hypothetical protein DOTSEDRAFT_136681 [Dothistroma septosporum NZE10]|uniref:Kinesin motor domain-containing protein n=1 Tax=Dothistroma septosporum (strain NZE10 / CBS 128990) TaxID=675120 RepID=N1PG02_DOTSN|nr:hypothetical protein DOTSEDRAFT_136681 [Dothistroma septosporum NZE10]
MEPPPASNDVDASSSFSPSTTTAPNGQPRRDSATMRQHVRNSSRIADATSPTSDEEGTKTAVKVAVRVRPPLKPSDPGFDLIPQRFRESTCEVSNDTNLLVQTQNHDKKLFVFDRVFDEDTTQDGVWEYVSDGVSSFVKGYNVSILAYGQSGAGKSYTMGTSGPQDQDVQENQGIVPRAAQLLFDKLNGASPKQSGLQTPKRYSTPGLPTLGSIAKAANKSWELRATYVEIYHEQLRDLLVPESVPQQDRAQIAIREDTKGRIMLTGLTQLPINSAEDVYNALNSGSLIRQTDATAINARSSRSHAVFSLQLIQKKSDAPTPPTPKTDKRRSMPPETLAAAAAAATAAAAQNGEGIVTIDSKLHFVDLAGSERLKNTGATGDRAKEGISINAGLASLGKVISQLSTKQGQGHISYRDSKLTRLLQDSLGGNAITFMVACVTPAIFHLSETLNTVHYAQRARAIQSKPIIQQTHEDGDKQAAIDRLRAEVNFLRGQIDRNDKSVEKSDRPERRGAKEAELHTQLMDMQENYNALSQRHAKLIAEISKSRDSESAEADTPLLNEAIGENASERIKRSNSFAEAVEAVVLEYEKTIQSLEDSLSKTRASLASTESTLMEKDTRMAYMDTIQQQLQARVSKYMEREANYDSYTRDLEDKMEGATGQEERKDTMIAELRKELLRVRESEVGAEDYISTLEERLAEAEQDQEIMQREIDRLEHVVERQRSIGRLDNLLGELDGNRSQQPKTNGTRSRSMSPELNGHADDYDPFRATDSPINDYDSKVEKADSDILDNVLSAPEGVRSPDQNEFMAEKLESLSSEFFELRSDHEAVLTDYSILQQKYRTALETLAKLEYDKDTPKTPQADAEGSNRSSFLAEAGMKDEEKALDGQPSSSRSLSEELSSQEQSSSGADNDKAAQTSENDRDNTPDIKVEPDVEPAQGPLPSGHEDMLQEMETLRKLHAEKEVSVSELTKNYMSLAQRHESTLSQVEELKKEVQQHANRSASPTFPASPSFQPKHAWRRRSDELLNHNTDRASRSYVSMKTLVLNNFEDQADVRQSFEQHLSLVMTELHARSERVTSLEAELGTLKKEMENKQQIIAGLTRERSTMAAASASAVDFTVIGQMRDQLMESESQIRSLHEQNAAREKELQDEVDKLKATLAEHQQMLASNQLPTPIDERMPRQAAADADNRHSRLVQNEEVMKLKDELTAWETKHADAINTMTASQANLLNTITDLQASLREAEKKAGARTPTGDELSQTKLLEQERAKHREIVETLTTQVNEHQKIADERVHRLEQLQQAYANILEQVDEASSSHGLTQKELTTHKDLVKNLENQLQVHKSAITIHQESLESLQASHTKEMEEQQARYAALEEQHEQVTADMQKDLAAAHGEITGLLGNASSALGYKTDSSQLHEQIRGLVDEGKDLHSRHIKTTNELKEVQEELQSAINRSVEMESEIGQLKMASEEKATNLDKMTDKYNKAAALVEQLEEQLNSNYDSHQATNKRLSTMQSETVQARIELERELEEQKARAQQLEHMSLASNNSSNYNRESLSPDSATLALGRTGSGSGNATAGAGGGNRKSGPTALPTPPPSIPLPPLPGSPLGATTPTNGFERVTSPTPTNGSPPASRHASHQPDPQMEKLVEEQEARIRTIEKHLFAEKQLTATLEEALVDLETSANRTKSEMENWRKKCNSLEDELVGLRKERSSSRASLQAVEEEREMRVRAERARQALEQRMQELNAGKKKKKNGLNCF